MPFPNITKLARLLLALLLAGATTVALAQERPRRAQAPQTEQRQAAPQDGVLRLLPADAVTEHSVGHRRQQARLYGDRRNALAVRPIGRALGGDLLHRLCRQGRRHHEPPDHLRVQRRAGRRLGVPQPGRGRPAHRRVRAQRRRLGGAPGRQSGYLARLHRPGDDRSGRLGLEPAGQARRRQRVLGRAGRRRGAGQDHRALSFEEQPFRLAQIHPGRKLRRFSRRQGGARAATRAGHHRLRHRDGVAAARGQLAVRRHALSAGRGAAPALAGGDRAGAQGHVQQGGAGGRPSGLRSPST